VSASIFTVASQRDDAVAALSVVRRSIGFADVIAGDVAVTDRRRPEAPCRYDGLELEF
jgi:hypothetical protein